MNKTLLTAVLFAACGVSSVFACEHCQQSAGLDAWATGCCEREPLPSDHLWDDYCAEKNAPKTRRCKVAKCSGTNFPCPGCSRWRPRGGASFGGFHGFQGGAVEAPIHFESAPAVVESHGPHCTCPQCQHAATPAPAHAPAAHGVGCLCPQCQAAATPATHGQGCTCPHCSGSAPAPATVPPAELAPAPAPAPAPVAVPENAIPGEVLQPTPMPAEGEFQFEPAPIEQEIQPPLQQQPFQGEPVPAEELPAEGAN